MLWILHQAQEDEKKNSKQLSEKYVLESMQSELRSEKLSNLKITTVFSIGKTPSLPSKKLKTQLSSPENYSNLRNVILAFILHDLELAISSAKIYKPAKMK
jgi:hypothetical protein